MPIFMPEEKARELPPAGAHTAICTRVVDLGTQQTRFGAKHQLYISWELPDEHASDGRPFVIGRFYNYSADPKATLRADIQGWLGRPLSVNDFGKFDLGTLLGMTCTIGIQHDEKDTRTFANITSVLRPGKGVLPRLSPSTPVAVLSLSDNPFDFIGYEQLPSWLKEVIAKSPEYRNATNGAPGTQTQVAAPLSESPPSEPAGRPDLDDEIPF